MKQPKKLKDILTKLEPKKVSAELRGKAKSLESLSSDILNKLFRSDESVAHSNLLKRIAKEIDSIAGFYPRSVEALAMCTRNIFELNLIVRHILREDKNLTTWLGQCITDEKDIIEGILKLVKPTPDIAIPFRDRLDELNSISAKFGIKPSQPYSVRALAKSEEVLDEYDSLFKLYSKYVHPSSWIVNAPDGEGFLTPVDAANIFIVHSQIYAEDAQSRLKEWMVEQLEDQLDREAYLKRRNEKTSPLKKMLNSNL